LCQTTLPYPTCEVITRNLAKYLLAVSFGVLLIPTKAARAADSEGDLLCEWKEVDIFQDDHAHSSNCQSMPPLLGDDWELVSYGHWTNTHSEWVYTTIIAEPGDQHTHVGS